mmetsp:Transcript_2888/g.5413  ORF Transcript_2888/g.5413 Transcript_2888/m.5413 type:complete len:81 (+) Transcript_2888:760-1002(+)
MGDWRPGFYCRLYGSAWQGHSEASRQGHRAGTQASPAFLVAFVFSETVGNGTVWSSTVLVTIAGNICMHKTSAPGNPVCK